MPPPPPQCILAQFGCHQYCPLRTGQASFTQYRVPPPREPSVSFPHPRLLCSRPHPLFSCVPCKSCRLRQGGAEGRGGIPGTPPSLPDTLNHTSCWFPEACGVCPSPYFFCRGLSLSPLSVSCFPRPSVPKPFQSFQMTIIGEKDCAAFSF